MLIAGVAGLLYARDLARGYGSGALGGVAVGAVCGLVAVASANLLGDRPDLFIPYGVMVSDPHRRYWAACSASSTRNCGRHHKAMQSGRR